MQVCTLLHTDNHTSNPPLSFFTGQMPFLPPNQQRQSTEGIIWMKGSGKLIQRDKEAEQYEVFTRETRLVGNVTTDRH